MKATEYIENRIKRLPRGYVFTYKDFVSEVDSKEAVIKCLNRMAAADKIKKLSKGKYYKPEETPFGSLNPEQYQIVKDLLEKQGKLIGYITGLGIYNQLGLTTQVSNVIQIGRNNFRPPLKRGKYKILFIKQKNIITKESVPLLQILDSIRYIKKIPDTTIDEACGRIISLIQKLSKEDINRLIRLAIKYNPATRALLGAILETIGKKGSELGSSLNPITKYKMGISKNVLPTMKNWNIE
ncbi:MAG: DUF6088 family protein [Crocinitomicaceae bacterium]